MDPKYSSRDTAKAIHESFQSWDVNVVDVIQDLSKSADQIAQAITLTGPPSTDDTGGTIGSLTEAVMGVTAGMIEIAAAIESLANAVSEHQ